MLYTVILAVCLSSVPKSDCDETTASRPEPAYARILLTVLIVALGVLVGGCWIWMLETWP